MSYRDNGKYLLAFELILIIARNKNLPLKCGRMIGLTEFPPTNTTMRLEFFA